MSTTRYSSPELDPVVLLCTILTLALLAFAGWTLASRGPDIQCPPQGHPVWAQVLDHGHGEWICGASLTIGVRAR